jgi:hypothetical protein
MYKYYIVFDTTVKELDNLPQDIEHLIIFSEITDNDEGICIYSENIYISNLPITLKTITCKCRYFDNFNKLPFGCVISDDAIISVKDSIFKSRGILNRNPCFDITDINEENTYVLNSSEYKTEIKQIRNVCHIVQIDKYIRDSKNKFDEMYWKDIQ